MKKVFFSRPASSGRDLHPKRSPSPDFRDRGVSNGVTNAGQFFFVLGQASLYVLKHNTRTSRAVLFNPACLLVLWKVSLFFRHDY